MWKLGLRPCSSFSGNICFEFSVLCLCRVEYQLARNAEIGELDGIYTTKVDANFPEHGFLGQGVTKRCRLSWLTNTVDPSYSICAQNAGGGGEVAGSHSQ